METNKIVTLELKPLPPLSLTFFSIFLFNFFFLTPKTENNMSAKPIREYDGKLLLAYHLLRAPIVGQEDNASLFSPAATKLAHINVDTALLDNRAAFDAALKQQLDNLEITHPWLLTDKLVAKPDQLIKRRGKYGLLTLNKDWVDARKWIEERAGKEIKVSQ